MIKLNVAEIKKRLVGKKDFRFELKPEELELTKNELPLTGLVYVEGNIANAGDVLLLSAKLTGNVKRICARCLKQFTAETKAEILEKYFPTGAEDIEDCSFTYEFDVVDITDALREGLLVAEPLHVLCEAECRGLCPVCGGDRNIAPCSCETATVDPRLIALQQLLKK
ncbi:MAG TPA: DUF177 domain-containing protein [Candidatus Avacidaminococcus intestinavium]|uniref:DUF177 domain-containing protein n=1 Tax=Candidatus Avacidaminococcus intestinavium TaxID=2840684 RepID=A0A9D1MNU5_9FIRM|nr:DUF177 domain-containing protein [Candidatus Avacidaminococcus intestinavium]